jgi:hypothetical protein
MEPDAAGAGERVFGIRMQGETVLEQVDIARETGGARRALVKEFTGIKAEREIVLEFTTPDGDLSGHSAPVLSAIEILEEEALPVAGRRAGH